MYHSDGDFVDDLLDAREDMDIEEETTAYKRDQYKLKNRDDFVVDTCDFFADQDEALSYKTRDHKFKANLFAKKSPVSDSPKTFANAKRTYIDHIMTEASNDNSDDDAIILPNPKKTMQTKPDPEPSRKKKRTLLVKPKIYKTNSKTEENFEYRKKFMYAWISEYKRYDIK